MVIDSDIRPISLKHPGVPMRSSAEHLDIHTDFDPVIHHYIIGIGTTCMFGSRVIEQGGELHAEAANALDPRIYVSVLSKRSVWLGRVTETCVLIHVGHFAAVGVSRECSFGYNLVNLEGDGLQVIEVGARGSVAYKTYRTVRHDT